jgi:hypothetical protein
MMSSNDEIESTSIDIAEATKALSNAQAIIERQKRDLLARDKSLSEKNQELGLREKQLDKLEQKYEETERFLEGKYEQIIQQLFDEPRKKLEFKIEEQSKKSSRSAVKVAAFSIVISAVLSMLIAQLLPFFINQNASTNIVSTANERKRLDTKKEQAAAKSPNDGAKKPIGETPKAAVASLSIDNPVATSEQVNVFATVASEGWLLNHFKEKKGDFDPCLIVGKPKVFEAGKDCRLGDLYFVKGMQLHFSEGHSLDYVIYRYNKTYIDGVEYLAGTILNRSGTKVTEGILTKNTQIDGIIFKEKTVVKFAENKVYSGILANLTSINGVNWVGGTKVYLNIKGQVTAGTLNNEFVYKKDSFPGGSRVEYNIKFEPKRVIPSQNVTIAGLDIPAGSDLDFHHGNLTHVYLRGKMNILDLELQSKDYFNIFYSGHKIVGYEFNLDRTFEVNSIVCKRFGHIRFTNGKFAGCQDIHGNTHSY